MQKVETIGRRIRSLRDERGWNAAELAKRMGVDPGTISRWENGKQQLTLENAAALSVAFDVSIDYLRHGQPLVPMGAATDAEVFPVVGALQAGAWLEGEQWAPDEDTVVSFNLRPQWRHLVKQAYILRGDSMNKWMPSGAHVLVASTIANGIHPRSGHKVLVNRRRSDGLHEATIKELEITPDGEMWLWPRSTSPEFQAPVQYREGSDEVTITGIVVAAQWNEVL